MSATIDRERDEYGRASYGNNEIPPTTERFAFWRGKMTSGYEPGRGSSVSVSETDHPRLCVGGWIESGEWWLHCSRCRARAAQEGGDTRA